MYTKFYYNCNVWIHRFNNNKQGNKYDWKQDEEYYGTAMERYVELLKEYVHSCYKGYGIV